MAGKKQNIDPMWIVPNKDVKSTSPDTANHEQVGHAKVYDDNESRDARRHAQNAELSTPACGL